MLELSVIDNHILMALRDRDPGLDTLLDLDGDTLFVDDKGHWSVSGGRARSSNAGIKRHSKRARRAASKSWLARASRRNSAW